MKITAGGGVTNAAYIPPHLQAAILLHLPSFHLRRLRRVCKHWRDVIADALRLRRSAAPTHTIAFFRGCSAGKGVQAMLGHGFLFDEQWSLAARFTVDRSARLVGTCNSLLCFLLKHANAIRVVDPVAGASIDVPLSPAKHGSTVDGEYCFGFDSTTRQYKIVHLHGYTSNSLPSKKDGASAEKELHLHVCTVGADKGWRSVRIRTDLHGVPYKQDGFAEKKPACCDGAVYWLGRTAAGTFRNARFDLATEEITSAADRLVHGQMPATQISCRYPGAKLGLCGVQFTWYGEWDGGCWPHNVTALPHTVTGVHYRRSYLNLGRVWRRVPGAQALQRGHLLVQEPGGALYAHEVGSSSACMRELRLVGDKKLLVAVAAGHVEAEPAEWYKFVPVHDRHDQQRSKSAERQYLSTRLPRARPAQGTLHRGVLYNGKKFRRWKQQKQSLIPLQFGVQLRDSRRTAIKPTTTTSSTPTSPLSRHTNAMTPLLPLLLLGLLLAAASAAPLPADFTRLLAAKATLSDPASALAAWDPSLSPSLSPCRWPHVLCRSSADPAIASLLLSNLSLAGEFPAQLCSLAFLLRLDLSYNSLAGPLPPCLAALPNLRHLDLAGNAFSGEVPSSYGAGFASLATLSLAGNDLSGGFPAFLANVSSLQELLLAYNPFAPSPVPDVFPSGLPRLRVLWLAGCCLVGRIPSSIGGLRSLVNLDLSTNNLTGEIPESIGRLENLVQIELYKNNLSGRLPGGLGGLKKLRFLDAAMNRLSGEIPADLFLAPRLESLHLYENELSGPVPSTLDKAPALNDLRLFSNRLVGELPEFGKNCPLKFLDLSDNRISGCIPATLCSAGKLEQLLILNNELAGSIPTELGQCRTLTRVRLPNNRLSGAVPPDMWGLPRLYLLELAGNALSGTVGPTIALAKNLSQLLIFDNHFAGVLPAHIGSLTRLVELSAANNGFSGPLPATLADVSTLARLDLRNNSFSGELPHGVRRWQKLTQLDLAHNRLTGTIPPELGELPVLNSLDLSNNEFTGGVPLQLESLKLSMFNLSNNRLAGNLPPLFSGDIYNDSFLGNPALCRGACFGARRAAARRHSLVGSVESVLTIAVAILILGVAWFWHKYRSQSQHRKRGPQPGDNKWVVTSFHNVEFEEEDLLSCLDDEDNVVGTGASGKVYRAVLGNEDVVAVKKLRAVGGAAAARKHKDGMKDSLEAEVATLGRIRHKNIVKLWCCLRSGDRGLLVYEYMPNGSLGDLLHGGKGGLLDWPMRRRIMVDAAEGLSYLHHDCAPPIVHRDVKSNNILLDAEFGAKVADFGVARVIDDNRSGPNAVSAIAGSCGYIAPEYSYTLRVTEKSDVYSFGVVMLELVTGKRAVGPELGDKDLVRWVRGGIEREGLDSVLDPRLAGESCSCRDEMRRVLGVALLCASSLPINRPSMRSIVKLLLEVRSKPAVVVEEKEPLDV
ncbi:hypothetical protein VPH35_035101 [Triticum aestivum]